MSPLTASQNQHWPLTSTRSEGNRKATLKSAYFVSALAMEETQGQQPSGIVRAQPAEELPTAEGTTQPAKRRRIQPDENSDVQEQLCNSCRALKLDDRSFGTPTESFGDTCTSPFPECSEEDGLTFKFISLPYTREDALPDLPSLSRSERDGCGFCALLAIAARREYRNLQWSTESFERQSLIISGANYAWQSDCGPSCLGVHMVFRNGNTACSMTIPFQVGCFEGTIYSPMRSN